MQLDLAIRIQSTLAMGMSVRATLSVFVLLPCVLLTLAGCGTTKSQRATEQLLISEAVDDSIAHLDFRALSGEKVYLDTQFVKNVKGYGFVNAEYIISSLRQQMMAADCRLQPDREEADFVVEPRVGALGSDDNEIVYGLPANSALSVAATTLAPHTPVIPTIPEISFARKEAHVGAAKIAIFAYERETGRPVWQSGTSIARSKAQNMWLMGAGPFQRGTIYDGTHFAGSDINVPGLHDEDEERIGPPVAHSDEYIFPTTSPTDEPRQIQVAGYEEPAEETEQEDGETDEDAEASSRRARVSDDDQQPATDSADDD